jgi:DNA-binding NtrC family response regulator
VDLLLAYDWPGNVRELASVIERAAILGDGKCLDIAGALGSRADRGRRDSAPASDTTGPDRFAKLDTVITRHIEAALERTRGKIEGPGGTAELLGLNPHTLRSKMRKLAIKWRRFRS